MYDVEVTTDYDFCGKRLFTNTCAVCASSDGVRQEVTELMGLNFRETECGDGRCGLPEDFSTCPSDCPSGGTDEDCDGLADGICDADFRQVEDPDCKGESTCLPMLLTPLTLIVAALARWV